MSMKSLVSRTRQENESSTHLSSPLQDEYHRFKGSLDSEEEEQLEDTFWVLTLAPGRKEGPDLETVSSQWQPEAEPGENSGYRPEDERTLGQLPVSNGVEEDGGNCRLHCDPKEEMTKRKQPEAEVTQEAVCSGAAFSHRASGGSWLYQVCGRVWGLGKMVVPI
ncbi:hypothetical protein NDU88_011085 [Pleurodeles waltl]|uniref:Uncharacterized protein n=1 Tax=Pleurodeles waltl TaxID=8319 RepID=A0AAV7Q0S0_PLEWA|nr:hypothetical protein NDU88_011085 [Pleurodeles waltl]